MMVLEAWPLLLGFSSNGECEKGHGRMTPEVAKIYGIDMDSVTSIRSTTDDIFHMSICPYHFHINHIISYSLVNIHKKPIENHHAVNG
jgi:hypothetical protein